MEIFVNREKISEGYTSIYPKKIIIAILVDRTHKTFPIKADIVGFPIATTLNEHIIVQYKDDSVEGAYLF